MTPQKPGLWLLNRFALGFAIAGVVVGAVHARWQPRHV
jgi:hypothetical protein